MTSIDDVLPQSEAAPAGRFTLLMRTRPELVLAPLLLVVVVLAWE
jgi:hypothetical protein